MEFLEKLFSVFSSDTKKKGDKRSYKGDEAQRSTVRKRQRMTDGFIWSESMLKPRACTIKDMSALGAQVDIWNDEIKASLLQGTSEALLIFRPARGRLPDDVAQRQFGRPPLHQRLSRADTQVCLTDGAVPVIAGARRQAPRNTARIYSR